MKKEINVLPLIHPTTIVVVGTQYNNKPNFTTIGDIAVAGLKPALIMISLHENHKATKYILENGKMSINMTDKSMLKEVDFAGMYSASKKDKSDLFNHAIIDDLPIVNDSPLSIICSVVSKVQIKSRIIFICKVNNTLVEERFIINDNINFNNVQPILYGLDNNYYSGLITVGEGYKEGLSLLKDKGDY